MDYWTFGLKFGLVTFGLYSTIRVSYYDIHRSDTLITIIGGTAAGLQWRASQWMKSFPLRVGSEWERLPHAVGVFPTCRFFVSVVCGKDSYLVPTSGRLLTHLQ